MNLPARKPARRNETAELTKPIIACLNRIAGVRVWRNNTGIIEDRNGTPVRFGLGLGSADIVGMVDGRFFALEVKWPGKRTTDDQARWGRVVLEGGGYWHVVHSLHEALASVTECRLSRVA